MRPVRWWARRQSVQASAGWVGRYWLPQAVSVFPLAAWASAVGKTWAAAEPLSPVVLLAVSVGWQRLALMMAVRMPVRMIEYCLARLLAK
ncbi:hypothetical protein LHK94_18210 [Dickeya zeae]|uniref:hypothetical protein n=1 Tax=Dickeya zeae TaxID=204042 RepID=UPI001CFB4739|nr:hypothetical protein [Dickeya zeae]UCZ74912.1 hypothetical protein LHK94_18210 [Dickeya zeae]